MASCSELLFEEQFQCSLCGEVFSSPVSAPCGHSFCRVCINRYWEMSERAWLEKQAQLKKTEAEMQQMMQDRQTKVDEIRQCVELSRSFPSLCTPSNIKDWSGVSVHTDVCVGTLRSTVEQLQFSLTEQVDKLAETEMQRLCQYSVGVALDPSTAHPWLALSEDRRSVRDGDVEQDVPDGPRRFDTAPCVLAEESYRSGRQYWEVQVGDKTAWDLGVAGESIDRKGVVTLTPGYGYWTVCLRKGNECQACADPPTPLALREKPRTVGVYVDYEGGQVSFYNVEARTHIYSFTGYTFTEELYPYFSPGVNDNGSNAAALVIVSPVNHVGGGAFCEEQQKEEPVKL
ncbi:hypothetical protein SKAU_G00427900 [Synaphobranchus kaupii]|uniref:Uncharacterized protein n=1 Tax=Synaphobranchus kaupii TaxID=118154 RepID=A0A9Q1E550_SYNKA|nr:hypothetical protein SKAU_G00427900 [Synaphobranchus kaupii]